jgi:uncharacterized protein (UPF0261 family)
MTCPLPTEDTPSVYLLATLDTKAEEAAFLLRRLAAMQVPVRMMDVGCLGTSAIPADVTREAVYQAAGTTLRELLDLADRGRAVTAAADGAARIIAAAHAAGRLAGILAIGGSAGTAIGTAAMRVLPIGVPKLMVSTLASGTVRQYVGTKDILMLNSIVDLAGVNRISRKVLDLAARAMAGMVTLPRNIAAAEDRPVVAATMFGVTTPCVQHAREVLDNAGYEVLVFHATGSGGQTMESLIDEGLVAGVLDVTTTELADELVGGMLTAGPDRLTAAARQGIPQVVSVGATDMVNFYGPETVPPQFRGRRFYQHNAQVTLMRTTPDECRRIGADIGRKLSAARGPVSVLFPLRGVSAIDRAGGPFDDPEARSALLAGLREQGPRLDIRELDLHVNDPQFAEAAARRLIELMTGR